MDKELKNLIGKERRITKQLLLYWNKLRDESPMPDFKELNPDIMGDVWKDCFVVKVSGSGKHATFDMVYRGENVLNLFQEVSPKGMNYIQECLDLFFEQVIRTKRPAIEEAEFIPTDETELRFRMVILPLSESSERIDMIVGGIRGQILPCAFEDFDFGE